MVIWRSKKYWKRPLYSLVLCLGLGVGIAAASTVPPLQADWAEYVQRFVSPEGRVIDTANAQISHSEGQGYGMLLAVALDDRPCFERLWRWTKQHLQIRGDALFAWRWHPEHAGGAVDDMNNASDGDLLIAWALLRAGTRWQVPAYVQEARLISQEIRTRLMRQTPRGTLLLPGAMGFDKAEGLTVNLSYWIFGAFDALQQVDPAPEWDSLSQTGLALLKTARFGRWHLPPDWLVMREPLTIAADFPPQFGYNAIRIPLYLIWAKRADATLLQPYLAFWNAFVPPASLPAWTNLLDDSVDPAAAPLGLRAIVELTHYIAQGGTGTPPVLPAVAQEPHYYPATLLLLTKVVLAERANGA